MRSGVTRRGMSRRIRSQLALPGLADQVLAKAAVRLGRHQHEAGVLIDLAGGDQNALGPQRDLAIAAGLRERDAFADQPLAEPLSAPGRIDQQQAQLGDVVAVPDQKYRADLDAVDVRRSSSARARRRTRSGISPRSRRPAPRTRSRSRIRWRRTRRGSAPPSPCRRAGGRAGWRAAARAGRAEQPFDRGHRRRSAGRCRRHAAPPAWRRHRPAILRSSLAKAWRPFAVRREPVLPAVRRQRLAGDQSVFVEFLDDAAEVAGIEAEFDPDLLGGQRLPGARARTAPAPRSARTGFSAVAGRARRACGYRSG